MDKAEDMLSEDTDADHGSDTGTSPPHLGTCGLATGEVRSQVPRAYWYLQQAGGLRKKLSLSMAADPKSLSLM